MDIEGKITRLLPLGSEYREPEGREIGLTEDLL
jgi:hypothetical protein